VKRIGMFSIGWINIEFFPGLKKIKQRRISFVLGYLRMILWKNSTAIYLYGFLNQSLGLILGNIFVLLKYKIKKIKNYSYMYICGL
jgi:hypothetical protein